VVDWGVVGVFSVIVGGVGVAVFIHTHRADTRSERRVDIAATTSRAALDEIQNARTLRRSLLIHESRSRERMAAEYDAEAHADSERVASLTEGALSKGSDSDRVVREIARIRYKYRRWAEEDQRQIDRLHWED
jgi:hypothetical protein